MISSGLCLFCRFIFVGFGCNKSSHSTWTTFSDGGQEHLENCSKWKDQIFYTSARDYRGGLRGSHGEKWIQLRVLA